MPQIIKDIILILVLIIVCLMFATLIINLFYTKAPYVPSSGNILKKILAELKLKPGQIVYDLGCGDGRFLIQAEKLYKIHGIGYEMAPLPYLIARLYKLFTRSKCEIILGNFFKINLNQADLIFCYLYPEIVTEVYHKAVKECRPGTIMISNTFSVKDVKPTKIVYNKKNKPQIYYYQI